VTRRAADRSTAGAVADPLSVGPAHEGGTHVS
jgi:hypothetical protein